MISMLMRFRLPQTRAGRLLLPSGYSRWLFWKAAVGRWERSRFQLRTAMAELFPAAGGALAASTVPGKASLAFSRKPIPMFQNPADSAVPKAGRDALGQDVQAQCMKPSGRILVPGRFY